MVVIICPNSSCQTANPVGTRLCQKCGGFIPHRYLWAIGLTAVEATPVRVAMSSSGESRIGHQPGNRYQQISGQIFLDTRPGEAPETPEAIPEFVLPYLYLSDYSLQVPWPYAILSQADGPPVLLLDNAAIASLTGADHPQVLPELRSSWETAAALRQLHWCWQIAQLWQPLAAEHVASSLLTASCLRVDGARLQLLALSPDDPQHLPVLADLGRDWQTLIATAHPSIRDFLTSLCQGLAKGQVETAVALVAHLDAAIAIAASIQTIHYELAILSDQGPSRQRNEDDCYPASGSSQRLRIGPQGDPDRQTLLMIVCDGIGGHQGGDVASKLAIAAVEQSLKPLLSQPTADPVAITLALEKAICAANDEIAQQNDQEDRYARDRMGTTLVMTLVMGHQLFIAHIGDSRAYRINAHRCQQITLDDDVASREVRLGYGLYPDMVHHPGAGALVQALGMNHSQSLHPNIQRFIIDEDSLFLLCSDGLSDNDRVDQFWRSELAPVFTDSQALPTRVKNLVQLANTYNGHDNVTIGLLYSQISPLLTAASDSPLVPVIEILGTFTVQSARAVAHRRLAIPSPTSAKTRLAAAPAPTNPPATQSARVWPLFVGILLLVAIAGGIVSFFFSGFEGLLRPNRTNSVGVNDALPSTQSSAVQSSAILATGSFLKITAPDLNLYPTAGPIAGEPGSLPVRQLPLQTVVQVRGVQVNGQPENPEQTQWVRLQICTNGNPIQSSSSDLPTRRINSGWALASEVVKTAIAIDTPSPLEQGTCQQ